jgi:hypothetical protein
MWKNIRAFGFASLLVSGVTWSTPCLFQIETISLVPSGVKGRSIGSIDPKERVTNRTYLLSDGLRTRFLEEPVDLALTDPIVLRTVEQPKPVQHASRVRARIQKVEGKEMGLGPETQSPGQSWNRRENK